MRISGGALRGRVLKSPKGMAIRPTTDKVREAIFSILGDIRDLDVLDICAGAGTLGLEALSRGARQATFVEQANASLVLLKANIETLDLKPQSQVLRGSAPGALKPLIESGRGFHLVFMDPPYSSGVLQACLPVLAISGLLRSGGIVVAEHDRDDSLAERWGDSLTLDEARTYGRTVLSFFQQA